MSLFSNSFQVELFKSEDEDDEQESHSKEVKQYIHWKERNSATNDYTVTTDQTNRTDQSKLFPLAVRVFTIEGFWHVWATAE